MLNVYDDESGNGEYRENIIGVKNEELYVETKYSSSKPSLVSEISSGDLSNHIIYNDDGLIHSFSQR